MPLAKGTGFLLSSVLQKKVAPQRNGCPNSSKANSVLEKNLLLKEKSPESLTKKPFDYGCRHCRRKHHVKQKQMMECKVNMVVACIGCGRILTSRITDFGDKRLKVTLKSCCSELNGNLSKVNVKVSGFQPGRDSSLEKNFMNSREEFTLKFFG